MPARQIEDTAYVARRIEEIFGSGHVEHRLANKADHQFHIFDNDEAIYTACHIATGRHDTFDFYMAFAQLWNCDGQMAVEGDAEFAEKINHGARVIDGELGRAVVIDKAYVERVLGDERAAAILLGSLDDKLRYLAIVRVPKGERDEVNMLNIAKMVSYDFDLQDDKTKKTPYSQRLKTVDEKP